MLLPRLSRLPRPTVPQLRILAIVSLIANIGIVITGGAVRLTGSGLGCPTVPMCTEESLVPHAALGIHGYIEFGNRMLTFVVAAAGVLLWIAAMRGPRLPRLRLLATLVACFVPAQAVIGAATVLTKLNPWIVMGHFLVSIVLVVISTWAVWVTRRAPDDADPAPGEGPRTHRTVPKPVETLARITFVAVCALIYAGAVVTGSGPHAGDQEAKRTGFDLAVVTQAHADLAFGVLGLTVGTLLAYRAVAAPPRAQRAALLLLIALLSQAVIGYIQYATDLPVLLVGLHMLGATLIAVASTATLLGTRDFHNGDWSRSSARAQNSSITGSRESGRAATTAEPSVVGADN